MEKISYCSMMDVIVPFSSVTPLIGKKILRVWTRKEKYKIDYRN